MAGGWGGTFGADGGEHLGRRRCFGFQEGQRGPVVANGSQTTYLLGVPWQFWFQSHTGFAPVYALRTREHVCDCACLRVCVRACVRACICVGTSNLIRFPVNDQKAAVERRQVAISKKWVCRLRLSHVQNQREFCRGDQPPLRTGRSSRPMRMLAVHGTSGPPSVGAGRGPAQMSTSALCPPAGRPPTGRGRGLRQIETCV